MMEKEVEGEMSDYDKGYADGFRASSFSDKFDHKQLKADNEVRAERIKELEELCDHYVPKNQGFYDFNCTQCETTWKGEKDSVCPVCKSED